MLVPDPSEVTTVFDTLVYLAWALFNAKAFVVRMMNGIGILVRNTFEHLVDYAIATKLSQVLSVNRMAFLCKLTEGKDRPRHIVVAFHSNKSVSKVTQCNFSFRLFFWTFFSNYLQLRVGENLSFSRIFLEFLAKFLEFF